MSQTFEWDSTKAETNFRKHGIAFDIAAQAFADVFGIDDVDRSMDYGELRFQLIGQVGGAMIVVNYTERGDIIRIISARYATRHEHDRYYRENSQN